MPIEFQHAPPVAALSSLAQHAGAVEAQRERRAELEAMNMQMLQMRKQEQQQGLDRVFNAWRTQYGEVSALQRMKADQQFRGNMQQKAEAQQMKGWDIQQEGQDRRQEADNIAAMKRQQDELRARKDAASITAADDMDHGIFTALGGTLNGPGKKAMYGIIGQISKTRRSEKLNAEQKAEKEAQLRQQIHDLQKDSLNTVVLPGEDGYRKDYDGYYTKVGPDGRDYVNPIHDPKEGFAPYLRRMRELHGHGETQDLNGDGIPDTVTRVQFETDDTGAPRYKGNVDVKIDHGLGAETPRQKQESRSNWISGMMDSIDALDENENKIKMPVFSAGAPQDMIQAASELSPWQKDAEGNVKLREARFGEGDPIPVTPDMRRSQLIAIANEYYQRMYETQAPGAPQAPGVGSNRLDPDMQKEFLKHNRPPQYNVDEAHMDRYGRPGSDDFRRPPPTTRDAKAIPEQMGDLDNRPIASEQAESALQGYFPQVKNLQHRALMNNNKPLARLYGELGRILQDPTKSPQDKRAELEALDSQIMEMQALQDKATQDRQDTEASIRESGMFDQGGR